MTSPNLMLPEVPQAILTASDELNAGMLTIDAVLQLAVESRLITAAPTDAVQGQRFIIPPGSDGDWADRVNHVAYLGPSGWEILVPRPGWLAWSIEDGAFYVFHAGAWEEFSGGSSPLTTKGDLFTHDGSVDARLPVGTDLSFVQADSTSPTGLRWTAASPVGEGASAARAYKNATQSIADSTLSALTWPSEDFDTDAYHSTSVNTSRFTAVLAGKYIALCTIQWDSNAVGTRELYVVLNGVTSTRIGGDVRPASAGLVQNVSVALDMAAADYLEFFVTQNSGGSRNVGSTTERISVGCIARVGVTAAPTLMRGATFTRGTGAIQVPVQPVFVRCPVKGTIVGVSLGTIGGVGSCVVDIWKDTHANYPPASPDSICAAAKPTIVAGFKYEDTTLTGWTVSVAAGDWLGFYLESSSTFTSIFVDLFIKETQ